MRISEIAEEIIEKFPKCCMASGVVLPGCRDEDYEEYLLEPLMDFFAFEILNMCGCGNPEFTHEAIRRVLQVQRDLHDKTKDFGWDEICARHQADFQISHDNELGYGLIQFMMYALDSAGLLEHGGGIGGAWLTPLGEMYLTVLNAWRVLEDRQPSAEDE